MGYGSRYDFTKSRLVNPGPTTYSHKTFLEAELQESRGWTFPKQDVNYPNLVSFSYLDGIRVDLRPSERKEKEMKFQGQEHMMLIRKFFILPLVILCEDGTKRRASIFWSLDQGHIKGWPRYRRKAFMYFPDTKAAQPRKFPRLLGVGSLEIKQWTFRVLGLMIQGINSRRPVCISCLK